MATSKKPNPTFNVRFVKEGLSPDKVPWRAVSEAISAVQDLASGRDPMERKVLPPDKTIGLLNVRKGSAVYSCISHDPNEARQNLRVVAKVLSDSDDGSALDTQTVTALKPIERLSEVAKSLGCRLEVAFANRPKDPIFIIKSDAFAKLSTRLFLEGETTIIGTVKRVGGQTDIKCALTVPGRRHLLYCDVEGRAEEIGRELGKRLYEDIAAHGTAVWIHSSWYIYKFIIRGFSQPKLGKSKAVVDKLRSAGLNAWDSIGDPEKFVQESRT